MKDLNINLKIRKINEDTFECNGIIVNTMLDGGFEIFKNKNEFIEYYNEIEYVHSTSTIEPLICIYDLYDILKYLGKLTL